MLYFSKIRILLIAFFSLLFFYFTITNFIKIDDEYFNRNINLGLDLQGGSYLLLEVDNRPVLTQKLQSKLIEIKNFSKLENILIKNLKLNNNIISFELDLSKREET